MKSKISFFNKTIFLKNVTLYWPIWGIYSLFVILMQSGMVWLFNNWSYFGYGYSDMDQLRDLVETLGFGGYIMLIAFAALFTGMALYSYMYNNKSANMIHALPVDRTQLFGTAVISGLAFLVVPLLVTALLTSVLCMVYTIPGVGYVWIWFLVMTALAIIAFSIVTICALFTGHIVVLPMYAVAVNLLSWIVYYLINTVITTFGFGVTVLGDKADILAGVFCPIQCFFDNLRWDYDYDNLGNIKSVTLGGTELVWIYLFVAVVLYVSAYIIYRKRKIEQAGDFLTVNWVKPIFRGVIAVFGAIYGAMMVRAVLIDTRIGCGMPIFVCTLLVMGAIFYFAADMFIKKSFHVFKKKNWIGCGISAIVVLVTFLGLYGLAGHYEKQVPKLEAIEYAQIHWGYEITLYEMDAEVILDIQKDILEQADYIESRIEAGDRYYNTIRITYKMKDGEMITRRYPLSQDDEKLKAIYQKIQELESNKENYLENLFGKDYANISVFYGGRFSAYFIDPEDREKEDFYPQTNYDGVDLDEKQTKELYYAIIADIKAGTLMKYNLYDGKYFYTEEITDEYYYGTEVNLSIEYQIPVDEAQERGAMPEDYKEYGNAYISIGPDCENVINKLIELEIIKSAEHIWWGGAEEMLK